MWGFTWQQWGVIWSAVSALTAMVIGAGAWWIAAWEKRRQAADRIWQEEQRESDRMWQNEQRESDRKFQRELVDRDRTREVNLEFGKVSVSRSSDATPDEVQIDNGSEWSWESAMILRSYVPDRPQSEMDGLERLRHIFLESIWKRAHHNGPPEGSVLHASEVGGLQPGETKQRSLDRLPNENRGLVIFASTSDSDIAARAIGPPGGTRSA